MKLKQCSVKELSAGQVVVQTQDEYIWALHTDLLEIMPAGEEQKKDDSSASRCFRQGDIVKIVNLPDKEMKQLLKHHGISSEDALSVSAYYAY